MEKKTFPKASIILNDGDEGDEIFFIRTGRVRVFKRIEEEEIDLGTLGPGEFFGEMSSFLGRRRTASVQAVEDSEILVGDRQAFVRMIETDSHYAILVIDTLVHRLQEAHKLVAAIEGQRRAFEILLTPLDQLDSTGRRLKPAGEIPVPDIVKKIRDAVSQKKPGPG